MSKIDDLRKLAADKSTTLAERKAAEKIANKLSGIKVSESLTSANTNKSIVLSENLSEMPPWIHLDGRFPHHSALHDNFRSDYLGLLQLKYAPRDPENWHHYFVRDEFLFETYSNSGIIRVKVYFDPITTTSNWGDLCISDKYVEIYHERDGWRDGPWWPRFLKLLDTILTETKAYEAEEKRQRQLEIERQQNKRNVLFTNYLKKI